MKTVMLIIGLTFWVATVFGALEDTEEQLLRRHTSPIRTIPVINGVLDGDDATIPMQAHGFVFSENGSITIAWVTAHPLNWRKTYVIRETVFTTPDSTESVQDILAKWKRRYSGLLMPKKWTHRYEEVIREDGQIIIRTSVSPDGGRSITAVFAFVDKFSLGSKLGAKTNEIYRQMVKK
jgi:hypothetical protein